MLWLWTVSLTFKFLNEMRGLPQGGGLVSFGFAAVSTGETGNEFGQIDRVMMHMFGLLSLGGDVDCAHAEFMRHGEVARIVLEHGALFRVEPVAGEDAVEGTGIGLGVKIGMFHTIDRVEHPGKPARGDDPFGYRAEFLNLVRLAKSARP